MLISIIAARAKNNIIGKDNKLPWNLPKDLAYFKAKTQGHYILMGRKTFQALPNNLPGRKIIVLTHNPEFSVPDILTANTLEFGIALAKKQGETELFICGGGEIYQQAIKFADKLYITELSDNYLGDTYFPQFKLTAWELLKTSVAQDQGITLTFQEYLRKV